MGVGVGDVNDKSYSQWLPYAVIARLPAADWVPEWSDCQATNSRLGSWMISLTHSDWLPYALIARLPAADWVPECRTTDNIIISATATTAVCGPRWDASRYSTTVVSGSATADTQRWKWELLAGAHASAIANWLCQWTSGWSHRYVYHVCHWYHEQLLFCAFCPHCQFSIVFPLPPDWLTD